MADFVKRLSADRTVYNICRVLAEGKSEVVGTAARDTVLGRTFIFTPNACGKTAGLKVSVHDRMVTSPGGPGLLHTVSVEYSAARKPAKVAPAAPALVKAS